MGRQGGVETGRPRGRLAGRYNVIVVAFRLSRSLAAAPRRAAPRREGSSRLAGIARPARVSGQVRSPPPSADDDRRHLPN